MFLSMSTYIYIHIYIHVYIHVYAYTIGPYVFLCVYVLHMKKYMSRKRKGVPKVPYKTNKDLKFTRGFCLTCRSKTENEFPSPWSHRESANSPWQIVAIKLDKFFYPARSPWFFPQNTQNHLLISRRDFSST